MILILLVAATLRIRGIGFGLPALYDPDEPLFMMTAIEMLRNHSLNPGWFGHPGTITLYGLALVDLAVGGIGIATGRYSDASAFVGAVYADPGILFLPARFLIAACGIICVGLTWRLGRRIGGATTGWLAAVFLAVNAVHIEYSQLIRTDIQAGVFTLLCLSKSISIAETGRWRDYVLAGLFAGLGCATKWPVAVIAVSPIVVGIWRIGQGHPETRKLVTFALATAATLILVSPFLLLDYPVVLHNLAGEARSAHPGATGRGFLLNLLWYVKNPLLGSLGVIGLCLAAIGAVLFVRRNPFAAIALLPGVAALGALICLQALRWERWLVPLLPFMAIMTGYAIHVLANWLRSRMQRRLRLVEPVAALVLLLPMLHATQLRAAARANDTRQIASTWIRANAPSDATILVEHAAIDLVSGPWKLLFPLGRSGCVDARAMLTRRLRYTEVERLRSDKPIIDVASVNYSRLDTCRARFMVLTHLDRYREERRTFSAEWQHYQQLVRGSVLRAVIAPQEGRRGGPTVYIFERMSGAE
ncbi:glycosyltransferase family 39 protein [Sphingomonas psychrotolerans]|uniref:Glycosyltransferase family 39 protein n=1 Tax=Sphingomonas psychrotolerans TaxID=1327635 RepID=A0ABU3MYM3_9SPHN|nr:glycosyltransferase family 39 protein [Sphingomonas psychrotolerans]MDT8757223.1 glycosyltransferase family 39 protein [Sphingomonas psychrotolerans]